MMGHRSKIKSIYDLEAVTYGTRRGRHKSKKRLSRIARRRTKFNLLMEVKR